MEGRPWRAMGIALGATVVATVVLNAQFFWLTLRHALAPAATALPEPTSVVARSVAPALPAELPQDSPLHWVGITNINLAKIPVGLNGLRGTDTDGDGLPDALEYALGTAAGRADTDGDRLSDYRELVLNRNPRGVGTLPISTSFTKRLRGSYLLQVQSHGELWYVNPTDGRRYYVPEPTAASQVATAVAAAPAAHPELGGNILAVPSLDITTPVVYVAEANEKTFQEGLRGGVVHYPGTAKPGEYGNVYIFGHSSDYRWSTGIYKTIFATLPDVAVGAEVLLTGGDGTLYTYRVVEAKVVLSSETKYLEQYEYKRKLLTLQTSWPVGTALKRYVVLAELVER